MQKDWMTKLSADLGLEEEQQDWGICNSDPTRIEEFILYFQNNKIEHRWEPEALAELIFQSYEDAADESDLSESQIDKLREFVSTYSEKFPNTLRYWRGLSGEEWHLTDILNRK